MGRKVLQDEVNKKLEELASSIIGKRVEADHPITPLNPDLQFVVKQVKFDQRSSCVHGVKAFVRGERTMWFGAGTVYLVEEGNYTRPVKFSATNRYGCGPDDEDDVYTVEEFLSHCESGSFIDYDGFGYPVKDGKADESLCIYPSRRDEIPKDATHIVWFNR